MLSRQTDSFHPALSTDITSCLVGNGVRPISNMFLSGCGVHNPGKLVFFQHAQKFLLYFCCRRAEPSWHTLSFTLQFAFQCPANAGVKSAPLSPSRAQGARGGDETIKKKINKKQQCKARVGSLLRIAQQLRSRGLGDVSFEPETNFPHHLPTSHERREGQSQTIWTTQWKQKPAERIGSPAMLSRKQSKTTCSVNLPQTCSSTDFIPVSICND